MVMLSPSSVSAEQDRKRRQKKKRPSVIVVSGHKTWIRARHARKQILEMYSRGSIPFFFPNSMGFPSSLLHLMVGFGCPLAEHLRVTLRFSLTVTSAGVSGEISGGTKDNITGGQ